MAGEGGHDVAGFRCVAGRSCRDSLLRLVERSSLVILAARLRPLGTQDHGDEALSNLQGRVVELRRVVKDGGGSWSPDLGFRMAIAELPDVFKPGVCRSIEQSF